MTRTSSTAMPATATDNRYVVLSIMVGLLANLGRPLRQHI
jgi:hypothetical protein